MLTFKEGDRVSLSTSSLPGTAVTYLGANKLALRCIGLFRVVRVHGDAYTLDIHKSMHLHPTFYVGRFKAYLPADLSSTLPRSSVPIHSQAPLNDEVDDDWIQDLLDHAQ